MEGDYGRLGLLASLLPDGAAEATHPSHIQNGGHVCGAGAEYRADPDMRNVDAWSLADAIVLICGPMTKRPRPHKPGTVGILDR